MYELLERLNDAEIAYKTADSCLDTSPLQLVIAREELKQARFIWNKACSDYVMEVLQKDSENVFELSDV